MMRQPLLCCLLCAGAVSVQAQSVPPQPLASGSDAACTAPPCHAEQVTTPGAVAVGQATRALLQRQASGAEANASPRAMSGVVAQKVYTRYVDSFAHPIPERAASPMALNAAKK